MRNQFNDLFGLGDSYYLIVYNDLLKVNLHIIEILLNFNIKEKSSYVLIFYFKYSN